MDIRRVDVRKFDVSGDSHQLWEQVYLERNNIGHQMATDGRVALLGVISL